MCNLFKVKGKRSWFTLIVALFIPQLVGLLSSFFTKDSYKQYQDLIRPSFSPPPWVFPVVWTLLFLLMGIASYRVYMTGKQDPKVKNALFYYGLQLFFNFCWTILFFGLGLRGVALIELLVLLVLIIITTVKFYRIDPLAGKLMIPYILWVVFAGILNLAIWFFN